MATSSTSESDSLECSAKHKGAYESQSRQLKDEGEQFIRASLGRIGTMCLLVSFPDPTNPSADQFQHRARGTKGLRVW